MRSPPVSTELAPQDQSWSQSISLSASFPCYYRNRDSVSFPCRILDAVPKREAAKKKKTCHIHHTNITLPDSRIIQLHLFHSIKLKFIKIIVFGNFINFLHTLVNWIKKGTVTESKLVYYFDGPNLHSRNIFGSIIRMILCHGQNLFILEVFLLRFCIIILFK